MGCNSHISIEVMEQWSTNKAWETWALDIPESRDYQLYEAMAGVRGEDEKAVVAPRGIPADASNAIKYWIQRSDGDGHSHSWLYADEFNRALMQSQDGNFATNNVWLAVDKVLDSLAQVYGRQSVRIVFFFDN